MAASLEEKNSLMVEWRERWRLCTRCSLCSHRKQVVPGKGFVNSPLMLIGMNPGADDDENGTPFTGQDGKLLNELLAERGIHRDVVFMSNVVACTSPGNRVPTELELDACRPRLLTEIAIVAPRTIVCLGQTAFEQVKKILDCESVFDGKAFSECRGRHEAVGMELIVTFHPASALRQASHRTAIADDLKLVTW